MDGEVYIPDDIGGSLELVSEATLMKARRDLAALRAGGDEFGIVAEVEAKIGVVTKALAKAKPEVRGAMVIAALMTELLESAEAMEAAGLMSVAIALLEEGGQEVKWVWRNE